MINEKTFKTITDRDLEDLIISNGLANPLFCIHADLEHNCNSVYGPLLVLPREYKEYPDTHAASMYMSKLCYLGIIPAGEYLIECN